MKVESDGETPGRWPVAAAAAALAGLALAALVTFRALVAHPGDLLVGPQRGGHTDLTFYSLATHAFPARELAARGEFPWWNPHRLTGVPFVGYPQSAWLYPPNWLFLVLEPWPFSGWLMVLHHLGAGLGALLLARRHGLGAVAGLAAGAGFLAAPYLLAHTGEGHYNNLAVVAWYPWAFLACERLRAGVAWALPALAAVLALALVAGHVQEWYYLVLALAALAAADGVRALGRAGPAAALRAGAPMALAVVLALALAAADFLPSFLYARQSLRSAGLAMGTPGAGGLDLRNLAQLVDPLALGGPTAIGRDTPLYWETLTHLGLVPLALALAGALLRWRRRAVRELAVLALVAFLLAFGSGSPLFAAAYRLIPGMGWFRTPGRTLYLVALAVALLAAFGIDHLARALARRRGPRLAAATAWALAALVAGELAAKSSIVLATLPRASLRQNPVAELLVERRRGHERALAPHWLLSDRESWPRAIAKLQSYEGNPPAAVVAAGEALAAGTLGIDFLLGFQELGPEALAPPVADLLGIRFLVSSAAREVEGTPWRPLARGAMREEFALRGRRPRRLDYHVYENPMALPRAFVVGAARTARAGENPILALRALDPRREALVDRDVLPPGERSGFVPATIADYRPNRVVVDVELERPGYLVLTDTWYPGWRARAGGRELAVLRANVAFRAVALGAGEHRVVFSYFPAGLAAGALVSLAALAVWMALAGRAVRAARRRTGR